MLCQAGYPLVPGPGVLEDSPLPLCSVHVPSQACPASLGFATGRCPRLVHFSVPNPLLNMIVLPVELQQPPRNLCAQLLHHVVAPLGATLQLYVCHYRLRHVESIF